ncbi:uncharacterized protein LOC135338431 isoform X3 [Halichondria panicea]|uniref:uncharacterized protein LOC135338431 isoform X3 n=1 Tax=Halichondria panicea TaxID=6063 RepID=UPI00312BB287
MATNVDSKPPIHDLFSIPDTDHKWFDIGLALGLNASTLQNVKGANNNDLKRKREMFRKVLEAKPSLTWREMLLTLKSVGLEESAKRTCDSLEWPVSVLDEPLSTGRSLSVTGYYSGDDTSYQILESLKPPQSEETTATASMRSASDSLPAVDTDSDIYHSAPSAGDDIYGIPFPSKAATTNFGPPSSSSGGYHSSKSTRPRTELMAGLGSSVKSFRSDLMEAQATLPTNVQPLGLMTYDLREKLRVAVTKGDSDTVQKIIDSNLKDVDTVLSEKDETALMIASKEGHKDIVSYLLAKKASVSHTDVEGATVLFVTASVGNYEVLKLLLSNPRAIAEINTKNRFGCPILLDPASKGFSMVSEYLLENGAKPNDTTRDGVTPLYRACEKGQKEVVKVLLEHKADVVKPCSKTSKTPLEEAVDREHNELVPILVKALKKVNERNAKLFTVTSVEQLRSLVTNGADVDSRERNGVTPLMAHTEKGGKELMQELIRLRANVDLQDNEGLTALMIAAREGNAVLVQILIGASAILDFKEKERGHTALMLATIGMFLRVVKELVLAKADINTRSRDGRTALDIAKELKCTEIVDLLTPSQLQSANGDPFVELLSSYLANKDKEAHSRSQKRAGPAQSSHKTQAPQPVSSQKDETSEMKDELKKAYRRIADLETRIHDLTLQSSLEIPADADLSYMDRTRLETEFRKNKELKKKAEQYAIEAKQTAQRLSAENFKLKEDLSKERHHNELTRKNMLREMEQKVDRQAVSSDLLDAKREVFEREISARAQQLLRSMPRDQMAPTNMGLEMTPESVRNVMLNRSVRVKMFILAVTGLPYSGKTTLVRSLLRGQDQSNHPKERFYEIPGFRMYEAIVRQDSDDFLKREFIQAVKQDAEAHAIATMVVQLMTSQGQSIKGMTDRELPNIRPLFGEKNKDMHDYYLTTYQYINEMIFQLDRTDKLSVLAKSDLTFLNIYDVGMNKAVFEIVPILHTCTSHYCDRIIQINALNLALYGTDDVLCKPPQIEASPSLCDKYSPRNDHQLMTLSPARDYYLQYVSGIQGYSKEKPNTIMVATSKDMLHNDEEVTKRKQNVYRQVRRRAEELRLAKVLYKEFIDVNATVDDDNTKVRKAVMDIVDAHKEQFEVEVPLKALFLRCFLHNKKLMFISRKKLLEYARIVNMSTKELDDFLLVFLSCGSLFCSPDGVVPFLKEYIILDPPAFIQEMDTLYYIEFHAKSHPAGLDSEVEKTKVGIVTERLAKKIWSATTEDKLSTYQFCLKALEALNIITEIKPEFLPPNLQLELREFGKWFFMPTVRTDYKLVEKINPDSLYVTYVTDSVPFHNLGKFVEYLQSRHSESIRLKTCNSYNMVQFEWVKSSSESDQEYDESMATISIIFNSNAYSQSGVVQVTVDMEPDHENSSVKPHIYSVIKTACVVIFHQMAPNFQYKLAVPCPLQSTNPSKRQKRHLLPFQIKRTSGIGMYCLECEQYTSEAEEKRLPWVTAAYQGPATYSVYHEDVLTFERLKAISDNVVKHKPQRDLRKLAKELGKSEEQFDDVGSKSMAEHFFEFFVDWSRSRENVSAIDLAEILDKCGIFVEATRLDRLVLRKNPKDPLTQ